MGFDATGMDFLRPFQVKGGAVAAWASATETFGTVVSFSNISAATFSPQHAEDKMNLLGADEHLLSVMEGMEVTLSLGGYDLPSLEVMTGVSITDSGTTPSRQREFDFPMGTNFPYFGCWLKFGVDEGYEFHLGIPRMKIKAFPELKFDQNKFAVADVAAGVARLRLTDDTLVYPKLIVYETATALPTNFTTSFGIS